MAYCSKCNKIIIAGNTNGLPNGVGFELEDGKVINLCQACIIKLGKLKANDDKKGLDDFFRDLEAKK